MTPRVAITEIRELEQLGELRLRPGGPRGHGANLRTAGGRIRVSATSTNTTRPRREKDLLTGAIRLTIRTTDGAAADGDLSRRTTQYVGRARAARVEDAAGGIRQDLHMTMRVGSPAIQYVRPDAAYRNHRVPYDAKGQRVSKSTGSPSIQETPIVAAYDAANRLTSCDGVGSAISCLGLL